eukprot:TRINITY_DN1198_c0_g1_i1.p1 TRINITY_DN1198_c0_g1~~TRINITY_DN1198_c0_g1_i1.p1  ORF type:complete len:248 (-),score=11.19 TRINITY_DN1198_c0_g1_i1:243-986(-)
MVLLANMDTVPTTTQPPATQLLKPSARMRVRQRLAHRLPWAVFILDSKKPVGDRLGTAAFNTVYGGKDAFTGPTLAGCTLDSTTLEIQFNVTLLRKDTLKLNKIPPLIGNTGGSQLYVQTNASLFCMEPMAVPDKKGETYCPKWAGGSGDVFPPGVHLDSGWITLNFTLASSTSIKVDLAPLKGIVPTAVRYAWGVVNCCDSSDPNLYVTHGCIATCPIMSSSGLPANPFQAKIVKGKCECVLPQVC